jgi:hypothetical protein
VIVYSRPQNRRGDARHPVHELDSEEEARGQQS